jgi:putative two-component system response regulator
MKAEEVLCRQYEEEIGSVTDALTGLYNHGVFQAYLEEECKRCNRYGDPFSLAIFDIDGLGRVNAEKGPLEGDRILKRVGEIISECKRGVDFAARFADNRYAIIYPKTLSKDACLSAERIRMAVVEVFHAYPTVSAGISGYPDHASTRQGLIERAQEALVEAKLRGHNKVVVCETEQSTGAEDSGRILIVDDDERNLKLLDMMLRVNGYAVSKALNGEDALSLIRKAVFDLVLSDVMMPCMDGYELCRHIKKNAATQMLPVIMLTALDDIDSKVKAIECGADDFMNKPPNKVELAARIKSLIKVRRLTSKMASIRNVIFSLAGTVEAKDGYTQGHIDRVSTLAVNIGRKIGLNESEVEALKLGGALHDIGKIAVPDHILNKPGPLSPEEWDVMKRHTEVGHRICCPLKDSLGLALSVVRHHHEKLDGSGYPDHLKGKDIPMVARIMAVVDIFDALVTDRPYRKGMTMEKAFEILDQEAEGGKLDAGVVRHLKRFLSA